MHGFVQLKQQGSLDDENPTALLLIVSLLAEMQKVGDTVLLTYTGEQLLLGFRSELFRHIQRLSFSYADQRGTADTVYRIQYDADSIRSVAIETVIPFVTAAFTASTMIVVTARIDWQLAIVALAVAPPMLITLGVFRRRLRRHSREVRRLESAAFSLIHEVLSAFRVVKAFGQEDREADRFIDRSDRGVQGRVRLTLVEGVFGILIVAISAAGTGLVLYIGVNHVTQGLITLGDLLLVMGYLTLLYAPLQTLPSPGVDSIHARGHPLISRPSSSPRPNGRCSACSKPDRMLPL